MTTHRSKRRTRKSARGHRQSTSGKILPPVDVRSKSMIGQLAKRIRQGPITIIMVYADWCGHCHHMMPHFDAASKSPLRSVQSIKLNETMLDAANSAINRGINRSAAPISVEGYPSILLIDKMGNKITEIDAVKSTEKMTTVMNESGSLAKSAGLDKSSSSIQPLSNSPPPLSMVTRNKSPEETVENIVENEVIHPERNLNSMNEMSVNHASVNRASVNRMSVNRASVNRMSEKKPAFVETMPKGLPPKSSRSLGSINTFDAISADIEADEPQPTIPPINHDLTSISNNLPPNQKVGGSLYDAMARSAYVLAPTAALIATSARMFRRSKTHKKHRTSQRKSYRK